MSATASSISRTTNITFSWPLFGRDGYAGHMGTIAMPTLIVQAASPSIGAWLLNFGSNVTLAVLFGTAVVSIGLVLAFILHRPASLRHQGSA